MIFNLCLMQDCQPYFLSQGAKQEITSSNSLNMRPHHHEEGWQPMNGLCMSNQFAKTDSNITMPVLIDVQGLLHTGVIVEWLFF